MKIRLEIPLALSVLLLLAACKAAPAVTPTATADRTAPATQPVDPTDAPSRTPPALTATELRPPATVTPWPTPLPAPYQGESIMGVELIGPNFAARAPLAAQAGAFWIRWNGIFWSDIEPARGERNWESMARFEDQVLGLNAQGLKLIAIVRRAPLWAQRVPGDYCGPVAEEALDDFGRFLFDLVSRYRGEPYNIKYWELGNEPDVDPKFVDGDNLFGCWGDEGDPYYGGELYGKMLQAVYPWVKAADPDAQVLVGGLLLDCDPVNPAETSPGSGVPRYCDPSNFLEGILRSGGGDYFDGVSFHAYDHYDAGSGYFGNPNWHSGYTLSGLIPALVPKARFLKSVLAEYGYFDKYLMNTETALLCGRLGDEPECNSPEHDRMKTDYVAMAYAAAFAEGLQGNIWFTLAGSWRRTALTGPGDAPLDAYRAYRFAAQQLSGAVFWGQVVEYPGVTGYKFRRAETEFWILWSLDADLHRVVFDATPAALYNVLGEPLSTTASIDVTVSPVYVEWAP